MKKFIRTLLLAATTGLMLAGTGHALDYDFSGTLANHNDTLRYSFTTNGTSNVTLFSSSWDNGNFDPMLGLWNSAGSLLYFQDDGGRQGSALSNGVAYDYSWWDSYFTNTLAAGTYLVTLSTYHNFPNANTLSDGFNFDGETPVPMAYWDQPANGNRGDYYEFHITGVEAATDVNDPVVPEPSTFALLGAGLAAVAFARRRRSSRQ